MRPAPCKDCEMKGCGTYHDECPSYLKWKAEKQAIDAKIKEQKKLEQQFYCGKKRRYL